MSDGANGSNRLEAESSHRLRSEAKLRSRERPANHVSIQFRTREDRPMIMGYLPLPRLSADGEPALLAKPTPRKIVVCPLFAIRTLITRLGRQSSFADLRKLCAMEIGNRSVRVLQFASRRLQVDFGKRVKMPATSRTPCALNIFDRTLGNKGPMRTVAWRRKENEAYPVVSGLSRCSSWVRTADLRGLSRWMMSQ